jgi:uncharacterized caspase-like protein
MHRFASVFLAFAIGALSGTAYAGKRVALVIGNGDYHYTASLANPANDAGDMASALKNLGFEVVAERNVDKRSMELAMARFGRNAQDADAALVYYAGHGIQYRGINYLMPIDARLEDEYSLNYELTRIDDVLFALSRARGVKILILDACRNNPLLEHLSARGMNRDVFQTRGLARIEAPRGMIVAYATQSDQVASDGSGRNSPFTGALLKEIEQPGLEIATLFRRVAVDVDRATGGRQLPELSISMSGEFYLNTRDTDIQAWAKLRGSNDRRQLGSFMTQYPDSPLVSDVRERLDTIDRAEMLRLEEEQHAQAERKKAEQERRAGERSQYERSDSERLAREQQDRIDEARLAREGRDEDSAIAGARARRGSTENSSRAHSVLLELSAGSSPVPSKQPDALSSGALVQAIKKELKRVGCYTGSVDDGWASAETKLSVDRFAKYANLSAEPKSPEMEFLDFIRGRSSRVCPLECRVEEIERNGRCVARHKEPAKMTTRPIEEKELAPPAMRSVVARADQAFVAGTYLKCMGATTGCYARTISLIKAGRSHLHTPEEARAWCSRPATC